MNRRNFIKSVAIGIGAASVPVAIARPSLTLMADNGTVNYTITGMELMSRHRQQKYDLWQEEYNKYAGKVLTKLFEILERESTSH